MCTSLSTAYLSNVFLIGALESPSILTLYPHLQDGGEADSYLAGPPPTHGGTKKCDRVCAGKYGM